MQQSPACTGRCRWALPDRAASHRLLPCFLLLQVGDLQPWMDESFLYNIFVSTNQLVSVKLIRNRATGQSEGARSWRRGMQQGQGCG